MPEAAAYCWLTLDKSWQNDHWDTLQRTLRLLEEFQHHLQLYTSFSNGPTKRRITTTPRGPVAMDLWDWNCETAKPWRFALIGLGHEVPHLSNIILFIECITTHSVLWRFLSCCWSIILISSWTVKHWPRSCCYHIQVSQGVLHARTSRVSAKPEWFHEEFETAGASIIVPSFSWTLWVFIKEAFDVSSAVTQIDKPRSSSKRFDGFPTRLQVMSWKSQILGESFSEFWDQMWKTIWRVERRPSCPFSQDNWPQPKECDGLEAGKEIVRRTAHISPSTFSTKLYYIYIYILYIYKTIYLPGLQYSK